MTPRIHRKPRVLAHLGLNHDGSLARALALVEEAAASGVAGVALPLYFHAPVSGDEDPSCPVAMVDAEDRDLAACELQAAAIEHILDKARRLGLVTVLELCDPLSLMLASGMDVHAYCLHLGRPGMIDHVPELLEHGRRLFLLTPLADTLELAALRERIPENRMQQVTLVCGALRPQEPSADCLELTRRFFGNVGFCDTDPASGTARRAAAAGADWILSYITLDRASRGPGHYWARDREGLRRLCSSLGHRQRALPGSRNRSLGSGFRDSLGNHPHAS